MAIPVIFNPRAGRKRATGRLQRLAAQLHGELELWPTRQPGHAEELAYQAAQTGHEVVAAAGGDGTVHEVANGLLRSGKPEVALAILPIGSANDYIHSLRAEFAAGQVPKSRLVDVGMIREPGGKERFFVCCLGMGLNGAVTRESRRIRGLQGIALYGLATLRALWLHYACPQVTLSIDNGPEVSQPTLMLSVLIGRREGGFVMAPEARMEDGLFDFVHAGNLSRFQVCCLLPRLALTGVPSSHPGVSVGRCQRLRLHSEAPLTIHLDGEFFCLPEDDIRSVEMEILPRRLPVFLELPVPAVSR